MSRIALDTVSIMNDRMSSYEEVATQPISEANHLVPRPIDFFCQNQDFAENCLFVISEQQFTQIEEQHLYIHYDGTVYACLPCDLPGSNSKVRWGKVFIRGTPSKLFPRGQVTRMYVAEFDDRSSNYDQNLVNEQMKKFGWAYGPSDRQEALEDALRG